MAFVVIVVLAIAWPVAGERVLDRLDAALTRDAAGCEGSGDRPPDDLHAAEAATLCLLNQERREQGLQPLGRDSRLDAAARAHSRAMAERDFLEHRDPAGRNPLDRMRAAGWPRSRGGAENIAWGAGSAGTPAELVAGWMDSPGHRRNILDRRRRPVGVGIAAGAPEPTDDPDPAIYTTDFG
jgi:uncharacterized protein YkwD